jgi:hypothetical protein
LEQDFCLSEACLSEEQDATWKDEEGAREGEKANLQPYNINRESWNVLPLRSTTLGYTSIKKVDFGSQKSQSDQERKKNT